MCKIGLLQTLTVFLFSRIAPSGVRTGYVRIEKSLCGKAFSALKISQKIFSDRFPHAEAYILRKYYGSVSKPLQVEQSGTDFAENVFHPKKPGTTALFPYYILYGTYII